MAVCIRFFTVEAGRKHACIVHDQGISRVKLVDDVVEVGVSHFLGYRINDQEFRGITLFQWGLSNQFLWQFKIKIVCIHFFPRLKMFSLFIIARYRTTVIKLIE